MFSGFRRKNIISMFSLIALAVTMLTCSLDESPGPEYIVPAGTIEDFCLEFDTASGSHSFPADGTTVIECVARVTDCKGRGISGVMVYFSPIPECSPENCFTNGQGYARTYLTATCYPGGRVIEAYCIGNRVSLFLEFFGDPPVISLEFIPLNSKDYHQCVELKAVFYCSVNVPLGNAVLSFWCEHGCFDLPECPFQAITDDRGELRLHWFPAVRGTGETTDAMMENEGWTPTLFTVSHIEYGLPADPLTFNEYYYYPLHHARLYLDGTQDFKSGLVSISVASMHLIQLHVFRLDESAKVPVPGVPITLELENSANSDASLATYTLITDHDGMAQTQLSSGSQPGLVTVRARIEIQGAGDCCQQEPDGWSWLDTIHLSVI